MNYKYEIGQIVTGTKVRKPYLADVPISALQEYPCYKINGIWYEESSLTLARGK